MTQQTHKSTTKDAPPNKHAKAVVRQKRTSKASRTSEASSCLFGANEEETVPAPPTIAELAKVLKNDFGLIYEWVYST